MKEGAEMIGDAKCSRQVVQTCDPRTEDAEAGLPKFEASLSYHEILLSC